MRVESRQGLSISVPNFECANATIERRRSRFGSRRSSPIRKRAHSPLLQLKRKRGGTRAVEREDEPTRYFLGFSSSDDNDAGRRRERR